MAVNYDDKRFSEVESQKSDALKDLENTYNGMIEDSQKGYNDQIQASKDWVDKQTEIQNKNTDFAIEQINQQREQTRKDYLKEQSGAYVDWQKQSNQYGANAEQMASQGLVNSGYSESSQVSMYNTYQNRVATARESYNRAVLNYDNAMKDARLQNKSILAEIAYNSLQQQLELSLQGFQYKNTLVLQKAQTKREIDNTYYSRYQDVLNQINYENAQAEAKRQHDEQMKFQKEQFAWQKSQASKSSGSGGGGSSSGGKISKKSSGGGVKGGAVSSVIGGATSKSSNSSSKSKSNEPVVDEKSVSALGYGPISASRLDELVTSGKVIEYEQNGKLKYKRASTKKAPYNILNRDNMPKSLKRNLGLK
jgi:hypothetical protein